MDLTWPGIILASIILVFIIYRFGWKSATIYAGAYFLGFMTMFIKSPPPGIATGSYLVIDVERNYFIAQRGLFRLYVYSPDHAYQFGDVLELSGAIEPLHFTHIEGQFDFKRYLWERGVNYGVENASIRPIFQAPWRMSLFKEKLLAKYEETTAVYLRALIFAERDYQADVIKQLDALNLIHLMNISGLLVYLTLQSIRAIMGWFVSEEKARRNSFKILLPWLLLVPNSVVLWRIIGGGIITLIAGDKLTYWNRKGLLGIIMLLVSKYLVYNPSFYLSWLIGSGLYLVKRPQATAPWWRRLGYRYLPTIFLLPYLIHHYGAINLLGLVMVLPIMYVHGAILILGLIQVFTFPMPIIIQPLARLSQLMLLAAGRLSVVVNFGYWSWIETSMYLGLIIVIVLIYGWSHRRLFHNAVTVLAVFMIFQALPVVNLYETAVYFINVGQGDAILIRNRKETVLIDTGGSLYLDVAEVALIPFFERHRIHHLDTVIITHDDYDHNGALTSLRTNFRVRETLTEPDQFPLTRAGIAFWNLNHAAHASEDNEQSLVLYFNFDGHDWLLMGDAPSEVEKQIMRQYPDLAADYLKVGHHGAEGSTSSAFLSHIKPQEAIISVGRNYYGHPSPKVLERLTQAGITIRRTDLEGTIAYV